MEIFERAKKVRLKGHHGKYLWADDDQYKISQNREDKNEAAIWRVEKVPDSKLIRLISCYDTYVTASDEDFLLGMTGKKVLQSRLKHIDSSVEWEPVRDTHGVRLKTCHGNYLRANNGLPPWRGSVTHDLPQLFRGHLEFLVWAVEVVQVPNVVPPPPVEGYGGTLQSSDSSHGRRPSREAHHAWVPSSPILSPRVSHPKPDEGREIFFTVANEKGEAKNVEDGGWLSFKFKGNNIKLLEERLQKETGIEDEIVLCARQTSSTKLYPLRLRLPPNNTSMHIVVVKASSSLARSLSQALSQRQENV